MNSLIAKAMTQWPGQLFKPGIPHFRERPIIPIQTSAHFIAFDCEKVSALYGFRKLDAEANEVNVDRKDNFSDGDFTLPDELCTTEKDYAQWNKDNPDFPVNKGHIDGSQFARENLEHQADIDLSLIHI